MVKLYRTLKFFFIYRKNLVKNFKFLEDKYGFNMNLFYEFYTVLTLSDAPKELKEKYGKAFIETEYKKFISMLNSDLSKLELDELVKPFEIKKIDNDNYGVAFRYSLASNKTIMISLLITAIIILTSLVFLGIWLF